MAVERRAWVTHLIAFLAGAALTLATAYLGWRSDVGFLADGDRPARGPATNEADAFAATSGPERADGIFTEDALRMDFDEGTVLGASLPRFIRDSSGHAHTGSVLSDRHGLGRILVLRDTSAVDRAARFPRSCQDKRSPCPKAIIEVPSSPDLDPGRRDFAFGARVMIEPEQASSSSNILQKGFDAKGVGQWKLQISDKDAVPQCVLVPSTGVRTFAATSQVGIGDAAWHELECRRLGSRLMIMVDGHEQGSVRTPGRLHVSSEVPLRIGGKSLNPDNNQYFGSIDDVWLAIRQ